MVWVEETFWKFSVLLNGNGNVGNVAYGVNAANQSKDCRIRWSCHLCIMFAQTQLPCGVGRR